MKRKTSFDNKSIYEQVAVNNEQSGIEKKDEVNELRWDLEENEPKMNSFME